MGNRIYISGAISGNPEYMQDFYRAELDLMSRYIETGWKYTEIVNPAKVSNVLPASFTYEDYMYIDIMLLSKCDAIYMLSNYKQSRGALAELIMAKQLGLEIFYEEGE